MASFLAFLPLLSQAEGGFQKNPADRGNYNSRGELVGTNWGISAQTLERWRGYPPTESDMRNLPKPEADQIYKEWFWDEVRADDIASQAIANNVADAQVNHPGTGVRILQTVLNAQGSSLIVDGRLGPRTLAALNQSPEADTFNQFTEGRRAWYNFRASQLAPAGSWGDLFASWGFRSDPSQIVFLDGWLNRLDLFPPMPSADPPAPLAMLDLRTLNDEKKKLL